MLITTYLDESGTHKESAVNIMAGFMGNVHQWNGFERSFRRLLSEYRVSVFHASDFRHKKGDFKGWDDQKRYSFFQQFYTLIDYQLEIGFASILDVDEYRQIYRGGEQPKKARFDTEYTVCFRALIGFMTKVVLEGKSDNWRRDKPKTINIVLEQGHRNAQDALRLYNEFKSNLKPEYAYLFGSLSFQDKKTCLPLACSDLLAYGVYQVESGASDKGKLDPGKIKDKVPYKGNLWRISVNAHTLQDLKKMLLSEDERLLNSSTHIPRSKPKET